MFSIAREASEDSFVIQYDRAYFRIRSPGLDASGQRKKVGKGSRQFGFVTLGKGLALRIV